MDKLKFKDNNYYLQIRERIEKNRLMTAGNRSTSKENPEKPG